MRDFRLFSDEELVFLFKQGNEHCFDEIYNRYYNKLLHYAIKLSYSREDAQEITDSTLLLAYKNLHKFRNESSLATWLYQILRNQAYSKYRFDNNKKSIIIKSCDLLSVKNDDLFRLEVIDYKNIPERCFINNEIFDNVVESIKKLPDQLTKTAYLYFIDNMPSAMIAEKLNIASGTIKSRTSRIRKYLQKSLKDLK